MDADKLRKILENTAPIERGKNGGKITAYSK